MDSHVTRSRSAGLPMPPAGTGATAVAAQSGAAAPRPTVDIEDVSIKLNSFFNTADATDKSAINRARGHIVDCVLRGERDVTVDLPDRLMDQLNALQIKGMTFSPAPNAVVSGDYPPPQSVVHIPEMKVPPQRAPVIRQPQRDRSLTERKISEQIQKLGLGMPGYGGPDRVEVIKLTCDAIATQISAIADEQAKQELRLEMAGALLQLVNTDPKRTSLVSGMFEKHLPPSFEALKPTKLEVLVEKRITHLANMPLENLEAYSASLKTEFRSIIDATAGVPDPHEKLALMGKLVNTLLTSVFREKQVRDDSEQCLALHAVVTEIINGAAGGVGGLRNAVERVPAEGWAMAGHKHELLTAMKPESVLVHLRALPPPPLPAEPAQVVRSPEQLAALEALGLIPPSRKTR